MDLNKYIKQSEINKIADEINTDFLKRLGVQHYYNFGIAIGLSSIYEMFYKTKKLNINTCNISHILEHIKQMSYDKEIKQYFNRIIKDIENDEKI